MSVKGRAKVREKQAQASCLHECRRLLLPNFGERSESKSEAFRPLLKKEEESGEKAKLFDLLAEFFGLCLLEWKRRT